MLSYNVLKYPGSKVRISDWICRHIPTHTVYLEPFFGGGGVFFKKEPSRIETINDIDGNVVNFFRVLRNQPEELIRAIHLTPYAREEYEISLSDEWGEDPVENARRFVVRCNMAIGSAQRYKSGFRLGIAPTSPSTTKAWNRLPDILQAAAERLKDVQIERQDALAMLPRYDGKDTFIYLDPPYLKEVRKQGIYAQDMDDAEHEKLLAMIAGMKHSKVMISGYESPLYNAYLKGWEKSTLSTTSESAQKRKEVIWMNYGDVQMSIDDFA